VELADGISPQDIKLFLTEADEQLQLLDEDIVRLDGNQITSNYCKKFFALLILLKAPRQ